MTVTYEFDCNTIDTTLRYRSWRKSLHENTQQLAIYRARQQDNNDRREQHWIRSFSKLPISKYVKKKADSPDINHILIQNDNSIPESIISQETTSQRTHRLDNYIRPRIANGNEETDISSFDFASWSPSFYTKKTNYETTGSANLNQCDHSQSANNEIKSSTVLRQLNFNDLYPKLLPELSSGSTAEKQTYRLGNKRRKVKTNSPSLTLRPSVHQNISRTVISTHSLYSDRKTTQYIDFSPKKCVRMKIDWQAALFSNIAESFSTMLSSTANTKSIERAALLIPTTAYDVFEEQLAKPSEAIASPISSEEWLNIYSSLQTTEERLQFVIEGSSKGKIYPLTWQDDVAPKAIDDYIVTLDIDSFRYVCSDLHLTFNPAVIAYPKRDNNINRRNHITVMVKGKLRHLSQIPNYEIMTGGNRNAFRVLIFFPNHIHRSDDSNPRSHYVNYPEAELYRQFYNRILRPALQAIYSDRPDLLTELPTTYDQAEGTARSRNGQIRVIGYTIPKQRLSELVGSMRKLIEDSKFDVFKEFFFLVHAQGLKDEFATERPGLHALDIWFESWNPIRVRHIKWLDYFLDIGVNITLRAAAYDLPLTLLWNGHRISGAVHAAGFQTPTQDPYCMSSTVFGIRAEKHTVKNTSHIIYMQAYHRDKSVTYSRSHAGQTFISSISPVKALDCTASYMSSIHYLRQAWQHSRNISYGVRLEFIASVFAARQMFIAGGEPILEHMFHIDALLVSPTPILVDYKLIHLQAYHSILQELNKLGKPFNRELPRTRLAHLALFLMKALVQRPDDQSANRILSYKLEMNTAINLYNRPILKGTFNLKNLTLDIPLAPNEPLAIDDLFRLSRPGGARYKHSIAAERLGEVFPPQTRLSGLSNDNCESGLPDCSIESTLPLLDDLEDAAVQILRQLVMDLWAMVPPMYRRHRRTEFPYPLSFSESDIYDYLARVDPESMIGQKKRGMTFKERVHRFFYIPEGASHIWYSLMYLNLIENYRTAGKPLESIISIAEKRMRQKAEFWALPAATKDRIWNIRDGKLVLHINPGELNW